MFHRHHSSNDKEAKHEQAIASAQDPKTSTTSEDAELYMINETKKAGGYAYQFDPDATPEQKAAQARSRVPDDFHHKRDPGATALVSDVDDGTAPQYDLPSPTKAGVVGGTGSRPSSILAPSVVEDNRWHRERTGWAPRFGEGDSKDEEGATLLDHQTWLESKLDDKWFGDWYYNAGIIIFACLATHVASVLGGGLAAVFIIMAACGTYYRTSLRRVRRNFRDDVHREMAKTRLESDTESLEWINNFLIKFWPIFAPVLGDTIINAVDQVLSTATPAFLDSLRMKTFILGNKPPRLEHVKTYPKSDDDIVLMDWKFSFNPNDIADMTTRQRENKINPKVALEVRIGKGVISKGLDVIVEDFAFSGLMRVKVKLQLPFPHVEKAEICFLDRPEIDYVCKPLGGDTFGFDINFIPGLESFIQEQIHGNLAPIMYSPNVFPIEIAKMLAGNPVDQAIGVLQITLHGGQGLKNPDKYPGIPDPYATVSVNEREVLAKTKTVHESANPRWNETVNVILTSLTDTLFLNVWDYNEFRKDKELGKASFALEALNEDNVHENLQLEVSSTGRARGIIQADIRFFPVLEGLKNPDGTASTVPESNTGIAKFTVEQAKDLDGSKSLVGQLSPYAILLLNGKEIATSKKLKRTNNPIWENAHKEVLITDRKNAKLGVVVKDDRDLGTHPILGTYQIKLNDMLELSNKGQEWYNLAGTKTGRAKMMLQWKPVALKAGAIGGAGYVTPIGVMRFHFQNARGLRNMETVGKSDPYVRVLLSGVPKGKTVTWQNNLNPDFDEIVYVPVHSTREKLTIEVMDQENHGSDRSLGQVDFNASDIVVQGEDGDYLVNDEKRQRSEQLRLSGRSGSKGTLNYTVAFYPTLNVSDPLEEAAEEAAEEAEVKVNGTPKKSLDSARPSVDTTRNSVETAHSRQPSGEAAAAGARSARSGTISSLRMTDNEKQMAKELAAGEVNQDEVNELQVERPKITLNADDLTQYESGLLIFRVLDADLAHSDCHLEVLMDDMVFAAWSSSRVRTKKMTFNETGDAMVRELDFSRITLRLTAKLDTKGEGKEDKIYSKVTGQTLDVLRQGLYKTMPLVLKGDDGKESKINVQLKYLPVKMRLDPSESINNMGTLRVQIFDAADLPAADRNGFSDPYCKFHLNGKQVHKTETQKKTLHPSWNETFEVAVKSRTAAKFKVEAWDWDLRDSDDLLGTADINLEILEPFHNQEVTLGLDGKSGSIRLGMLFKPDYVTRSRQGSSTFRGTFATPGKVVGAPVKGVGKGAVFVGGNVIRGASFVTRGFRRRKTGDKEELSGEDHTAADSSSIAPSVGESNVIQSHPPSSAPKSDFRNNRLSTPDHSSVPPAVNGHHRAPSMGAASTASGVPGKGGADAGTASFSIVSATGFEGSNIRVLIRQHTPKGLKDVHKSKTVKSAKGAPDDGSASPECHWDESAETFTVKCAPDTQFSVAVRDVHTFGADHDLGEGMLVVADTAPVGGAATTVHVGAGTVVVKSSFQAAEGATNDGTESLLSVSPARSGTRRLLGRSPRNSRQSTPAE